MAISFLDDINLNDLEAQNLVVQNLGSDPTGVEGKIIYNTGTNTIKYYNGTGWISLPDGTGIVGSGTVGTIPIFASVNELGDSGLTVTGTGASTVLGVNYNSMYVKTLRVQKDIEDINNQTGTAGQLLSSLGGGGAGVDWIDAPVGYTGWGIKPDGLGNTLTIGDGNFVNVSGSGSVETSLSSAVGGANLTVALTTDVTIVGDLTVGGGDITLNGTGRIQGVDTVTIGTDAASKQYVDNAISGSGSLIFQGGYNAATNTPNLDNTPTLDILKGWTYVVTVGGSFFTETVEVGDLLIAEINDPTALANWTTVQNNVDIATLTNVGIGNVIPSTVSDQLGIGVVYNGAGTASLGLDIAGLTEGGGTPMAAAGDMMVFQDVSATPVQNFKISILNLAAAIGASGSVVASGSGSASYFITHNFNTRNVIVEIFETASPYQTVYGTVTRPNLNQVKVTFAAVTGSLTFLAKKV
mgnify:CR=1 FL=1